MFYNYTLLPGWEIKIINYWVCLMIYCPNFLSFFAKNLTFLWNVNSELKRGHENEVRVGHGKLKINFARPNSEISVNMPIIGSVILGIPGFIQCLCQRFCAEN